MPGVVLRASHVLIYLILSTTSWNECLSLRHQFTDRELTLQGQCDSKTTLKAPCPPPRVHTITILAGKKPTKTPLSLEHRPHKTATQFSSIWTTVCLLLNIIFWLIQINSFFLEPMPLQSSRRQVDNMKLIIGAKQNLSLDPACKFLADNPGQILNPLHQSLLICKCLQSVLLLLKFF